MPRRRPSALRGEIPVRGQYRPPYAPIDRLSGSCTADIRRLERARFSPESTTQAFRDWTTLAHGPLSRLARTHPERGSCSIYCECRPGLSRDHLEEVLHALPRKSARELRTLVRSLDRTILDRAKVLRADAPDVVWWRGKFCESY
ncbi:hypothetical protein [Streptomyces sp. B21-083]|uniref:hypothetical protein n=1 Tax=Streptomyces sp. B21-083 TaxID=3039410 RepID=UPI002FEF2410